MYVCERVREEKISFPTPGGTPLPPLLVLIGERQREGREREHVDVYVCERVREENNSFPATDWAGDTLAPTSIANR